MLNCVHRISHVHFHPAPKVPPTIPKSVDVFYIHTLNISDEPICGDSRRELPAHRAQLLKCVQKIRPCLVFQVEAQLARKQKLHFASLLLDRTPDPSIPTVGSNGQLRWHVFG